MATTSYGTPYVVSADLVSGYPGTSLSLADRVDDISFKGNGINNQTGTTYTLDILDAGKTVTLNNSSAVTVTIPTNTAEAIEIGSIIRFNNKGAGTVTIQPDGGVTLNGGNITLAQNAAVQIIKLDTNTWGAIESLGTTPGLTLITSQSFTSASTVSVNNCFSSSYVNYRIMVIFTTTSGDEELYLRLRASSTDANTNYDCQSLTIASTTVSAARTTGATAYIVLGGASSTNRNAFSIDVFGPNEAAVTAFIGNAFVTAGNARTEIRTARHTTTSSYDGFSLIPQNGGSTLSGSLRVYGYRNS